MAQYTLPDLPYDYAALEPHISARIMQLHHDKHHKAYVDGANKALEQIQEAREKGNLASVGPLERALAFNVSGHVLHSLFWQNLTPNGGGEPSGELASAITRDFGSFAHFKEQMTKTAATIMGSGWAALAWEPLGERLVTVQIYDHQSNVTQAGLPIMVQDAPLSGVNLSVPLLVRLAKEVPAVRYFKIEMPGTAAKLRALIAAGGDAIAGPFDGEESITLMADLDAGATGTMPSALLPDLIKPVVTHYLAGRRAEAVRDYARILPLINFENRQCGLRATKTVMKAGGVIRSDAVRHPLEPLHPATREGLLELAREADPLALRWGKS